MYTGARTTPAMQLVGMSSPPTSVAIFGLVNLHGVLRVLSRVALPIPCYTVSSPDGSTKETHASAHRTCALRALPGDGTESPRSLASGCREKERLSPHFYPESHRAFFDLSSEKA